MAKKLTKSAKLDLIVSELAKVKVELKKLSKQHAALASELEKRVRPAAVSKVKKRSKPAGKAAAKTAPVRGAAPKRPVLIQPEPVPAAGRAAAG
jgi:hypothetical protein